MARCREVIHSVREMNGEQTKGRQSVVGAEDERNWVGGQSKKRTSRQACKKTKPRAGWLDSYNEGCNNKLAVW